MFYSILYTHIHRIVKKRLNLVFHQCLLSAHQRKRTFHVLIRSYFIFSIKVVTWGLFPAYMYQHQTVLSQLHASMGSASKDQMYIWVCVRVSFMCAVTHGYTLWNMWCMKWGVIVFLHITSVMLINQLFQNVLNG